MNMSMNYDEVTHHFMNDFYESFAKDPTLIDKFYSSNAKLIITYQKEPQKNITSNRNEFLPKGEHKIFRWNGQKNGEQIIGHITGYVKINNDNNNDKYYQSNEMIVYSHTTQDQDHPYQILYHSIHLLNIDPPPQLEQKPEAKPEQTTETKPDQNSEVKPEQKPEEQKEKTQNNEKKASEKAEKSETTLSSTTPAKTIDQKTPPPPSAKPPANTTTANKPQPASTQAASNSQKKEESGPILIDNANSLIKSRTVLAYNLPFNIPQQSIIPEFEIYGKVTRYAIVKGRILIEFENPNSLMRALDDGNFYWNNRYIKIKQMEDQFN
ncbi:hypothetical protein M9Y10_028843 [Tritrichomonas musculus]|uniref:RRM domain-containing protein n=1 Tax=Tritrichomonas musculus TaxID=1915356 RepID=A0ABR2KKG1_9EUKA